MRENIGEDVDTEQLIQETCRSCLEQVSVSCRPLLEQMGALGGEQESSPSPPLWPAREEPLLEVNRLVCSSKSSSYISTLPFLQGAQSDLQAILFSQQP